MLLGTATLRWAGVDGDKDVARLNSVKPGGIGGENLKVGQVAVEPVAVRGVNSEAVDRPCRDICESRVKRSR